MSDDVKMTRQPEYDMGLGNACAAPHLTTRSFLPYSFVLTAVLGYLIFSFEFLSPLPYHTLPKATDDGLREPRVAVLPKLRDLDPAKHAPSGDEETSVASPRDDGKDEKIEGSGLDPSQLDELQKELLSGRGDTRTRQFGQGQLSPHDRTSEDVMKTAMAHKQGGTIDLGEDIGGFPIGLHDDDTTLRSDDATMGIVPGRPGSDEVPGPPRKGTSGIKGAPGIRDVIVTGSCRQYEDVRQTVISKKWTLGRIHMFHREQGRPLGSITAVVQFTITREGSVRDCRVRTEPTSYPAFERKLVAQVSKFHFGTAGCIIDVRWTIRF